MNVEPRRGDWMQTFTGRQFWPLDPHPQDIIINDIAHSLSMQCRYAGHCVEFYSVAEHSVHVARWVLAQTGHASKALAGLLHDAPEAYLVDVPRPVKPYLTGYRDIEQQLWRTVCERFGLDVEMPAEVKDADNRILLDERAQNMIHSPHDWAISGEPLGVTIECWPPALAKRQFTNTFWLLNE